MDIAFFDPDRTHADYLRSALDSFLATDKWRSAKYGVAAAGSQWRRGSTPDDVRAGYDERLRRALQELREATPESDDDEDEEGEMTSVRAWPRVKGWRAVTGELATPPTSGDEEDDGWRAAGLGKRKRGASAEREQGVKRVCAESRASTFGQQLETSRSSPRREAVHASRRLTRLKMADGIVLYNTHAMTTRSKARKVRNPG
ncbi:hypothetical protein MPH_07644 [Macrophomina phaseolina MS6]|uniref:Uncharacterized protein n=1 Tax=Macrophomina phaseolina (strain MS6) TaxID=1126212 RepID=K2RR07_MACPH|nr:hypothetical protein MPH_07644 [Macrophomina phaseolina MS6]